jgi:dTDP-4-amino-4,6-dideoxygalactose transaminase
VQRRDQLREHLLSQQIGCAVYYPKGLHQQPCFSELGYRDGDFPICEEATRTSLALPIFPELDDQQICRVVEQVVSFTKK